jgi:hypothetical protein
MVAVRSGSAARVLGSRSHGSFFRNPFITQFALRFHGYCVSVIPA